MAVLIAQRLLGWVLAAFLGAMVLAHPVVASRAGIHEYMVVLVGVVSVAILVSTRRRGDVVPPAWLLAPAVLLVGGAVVSLAQSREPSWPSLCVLLGQLLFVWVGWWLARQGGELVRPVAAMRVLGAAAAGAYGLLHYGQVDPPPRAAAYGSRAVSTFENPNYLASFEALVLPLALVGFCRVWDSRESAGWLALVAAIYTGVLLSASRGAWIGAVAGCAVLLVGIGLQSDATSCSCGVGRWQRDGPGAVLGVGSW